MFISGAFILIKYLKHFRKNIYKQMCDTQFFQGIINNIEDFFKFCFFILFTHPLIILPIHTGAYPSKY